MNIIGGLTLGTFDLHLHSTASDGVYAPSEVVQLAKKARVQTIALTDHDTLAGVDEARRAGRALGVDVVPGVEISTTYNGRNVDILGYNMTRDRELHEALGEFRRFRETRAQQIIEKLAALNMPLTSSEVKAFSGDGVVARPHIAQALVKKGYVTSVQQAFDTYLGDGKPAAVAKKEMTTAEGIRLIREAGGQAVLAHPVYIGDEQLLHRLLRLGFDGIEVWHRNHTPQHTRAFLRLAEMYALFVTGGSDFHHDEHQIGKLY
ncbi:PHP domain-containing protein [Numidum massiliense]|uniref:PHP domain-containing protein n=1 Tax=Numidum massiliense TaxID=1522315 RepID=UPI0006D54ABA|nr:PHP domain-containing protein [Numidum massiliense]